MGMKTAISVPDALFQDAEQLARKLKKSRSQLFSEALAEYLARHTPDDITEAMNRVVDLTGEEPDPAIDTAARKVLERVEW